MRIKPIGDNVLVKEVDRESHKGEILIKTKDSPRYVEVVGISDKVKKEYANLKVGDLCVIDQYCGNKIGHDDLVLVHKSFLRIVIEDEK